MQESSAYERVVSKLQGIRETANGVMARCPAHDDHNPSLSITPNATGVLLNCFAGCATEEIVCALGLQLRDLYEKPLKTRLDQRLPDGLEWVESYDYRNEGGNLVFQVVRAIDSSGKKTFRQRRPDSVKRSGWAWNLRDLSSQERALPYLLPEVLRAVETGEVIWIAEGEKDVHALHNTGVVATCNAGGAEKWTRQHSDYLRGAHVVVLRDCDEAGERHQALVARSLDGIAASVSLMKPAAGKDAADHFASGYGIADFLPVEEANAGMHHGVVSPTTSKSADSWYEERGDGLYHVRAIERQDGETTYTADRLTNFVARIAASTEVDDGAEVQRRFHIEARVAGRKRTASISAAEFSRMDWIVPELGPSAIIEAGRGTKDHARAAIQSVSAPAEVRVMRQTGWREFDGAWAYLHGGGAIGAQGPVEGIEVDLQGSLGGFTLPEPGGVDEVRESLRMLDVAPDRVTIPLLAAVVRAPLGGVDNAVSLHGQTGIGKSELAALAQQHYGAPMDARSLPASWSSTANSLEEQAFLAADALLTVDDFVTTGSPRDIERLHSTADRLIRGAGNGAGRGRMSKDGTLRDARPARGMILVTGEEVPHGQSLRARMMTLEVRRGDVDWNTLSRAQLHAAEGTYAAALAAYLQWLAPRLNEVRANRRADIAALRNRVTTLHRRTATAIASLAWGWATWLDFAVEIGAISEDKRGSLWNRGWTALLDAAEAADASVGETDPAKRFMVLLGSAVASGRAHVATRGGGCPPGEPGAWGWRTRDGVMTDMGTRIGWTEDNNLWLDPEAAYSAAKTAGEGLNIDLETLRSRLSDSGLLQSLDPSGKTGVRVRLQGRQRRVLHLSADALGDAVEVRHQGVSEASQGVSDRVTPRHHRDTLVSRSEISHDLEKRTSYRGESPETPGKSLVTEKSRGWDIPTSEEDPENHSGAALTTARSARRVTSGSHATSRWEVA